MASLKALLSIHDERMSPENREQTLTYLSSIWGSWVDEISKSRNIAVAELNRLADNMEVYDGKSCMKSKLVDSLIYKDQLLEKLKAFTGIPENRNLNTVTLEKYFKVPPVQKTAFSKNKIAVMSAPGEIGMGDGSNTQWLGRSFEGIRQAGALALSWPCFPHQLSWW